MLITVLALFIFLQFIYLSYGSRHQNGERVNDILSSIVFCFFIFLFFFKNEYFGADTQNYLAEFREYCSSPDTYSGLDFTYKIIFYVINTIIAGTCSVSWLIWVWPLFVISIIYFTAYIFKYNKVYIVALFSSFIGIELLTNAMRQGFSIAILLLAFGFFLKGRHFYFFLFSSVSFLFHQASILIFIIFIISRLNFKILIPSILIGIYMVFFTSYLDLFPGVNNFKSSIYKYFPYANEDFIVRLISILSMLCTCIVYMWMGFKSNQKDKKVFNSLLNIMFICVAVSIVPYLGFRVVYGVYPLLLLMTYSSVKRYNGDYYVYLSIVTCINAITTIIWLCGSAHMRAIPFVSLI